MILSADGRPYVADTSCSRCGEGKDRRQIVQALGGNWRVVCSACGNVFEQGRGEPPDPTVVED